MKTEAMTENDSAIVAQALLDIVSSAATRHPTRLIFLPEALLKKRLAHVTMRAGGRKVRAQWLNGSVPQVVSKAVAAVAEQLPRGGDEALTTVEVTLPRDWAPLDHDDLGRARCNDFRGVYGLELRGSGEIVRMSPLEIVARNLMPDRTVEILKEEIGAVDTETWKFAADQYLVELREGRCTQLFRGQPVVAQSDITRKCVSGMAGEMTAWLARQVASDGKTAYKYWPSNGNYSDADNALRQFMASACLALAARRGRNRKLAAAVKRNFQYNFGEFYRDEDACGVIDDFGKVKLGAAAVAVMAILNLPDPGQWNRHLARLRAFIESMQQDDGSFRTFLRPEGRNDNQNFYPGESALAMARLYAHKPEDALLDRLRACFAYYRSWHRNNRNPAFVPWHSQAYCLFHEFTGEDEVAAFVFEMNDWLLKVQEVDDCAPDVVGDFFDPSRPWFGPPHASATGVYLEGLVEAWKLARRLGEVERADAYRRAMLRGLRSLRQMQFRSSADMFYIQRRSRVQGGLRSSGFDNTLRIDNVQHGLMAIFNILDHFSEEDYHI
jgi:hypothetical protein